MRDVQFPYPQINSNAFHFRSGIIEMFVRICKFFVVDQPTSRYDICVAWFGLRTPAQIVARVFAPV